MSDEYSSRRPAFPTTHTILTNSEGEMSGDARDIQPVYTGMSLRDYFAGQAIVGLLAGRKLDPEIDMFGDSNAEELADTAYMIADTLLESSKESHS